MNKEETVAFVGARNAEALFQALRDLTSLVHSQGSQIIGLQGAITALSERIVALESSLNSIRAINMGSGPTVK